MTHLPLRRCLAVFAGAALIFAACGGGDETSVAPQDDVRPAEKAEKVALANPIGLVMASVDLVDSAGFHAMAEDLATATEINPRHAGKVASVVTAMAATEWPDDLSAVAAAFHRDLVDLQQALESGDLAAAAAAAEKLHEGQHDFSHEAYNWLGTTSETKGSPLPTILATVDLVDSSGFHDMAEDLAAATEVNPRYAGQVGNVIAAMDATGWISDLEAGADAFRTELESLQTALAADDLVAARAAVEAVHEAQHDFSHGIYGWLGSYEGGTEAVLGAHHGPDMMAVHLKSIDMVDTIGLHDMATDIAQTAEVNPRYAGQIENLIAAVDVAEWPVQLSGITTAFVTDLSALQTALEGGDIEAARVASEKVHESQHDFSHSFYGWLAES